MHEVRLYKPFAEGSLMLSADGIHHEDYEGMITCWFKEEIDWCTDRKIDMMTRIDLETWEIPIGNKMKAIVQEGLNWPGPDVIFVFYNREDAMLFRLRWA